MVESVFNRIFLQIINVKRFAWLLPFSFILAGCPFESKVPLEAQPTEAVDSTMLGYWYGIIKDGSDYFGIEALDITQKSDSLYSIIRYGKAAKGDIILPDTSYFTAYTSHIGNMQFLNVESSIVSVTTRKNKPPMVKTDKIYYVALFEKRNDTMLVKAISENFVPNSRKGFKRPEDLKQAVVELTGAQANIYDDLYTLSYRKIPRPQPMKPF